MGFDRRIALGTIPVAAVAGGLAATLLLGTPTNRPVQAQDTVKLTTEQRSTAKSLEGAFINIADTIGPATVYIRTTLEEPTPVADFRQPGAGGDNFSSPFDDLFPFPQLRQRRGQGFIIPRPRTAQASGSGVIVRPDGYILTNDHVVAGAKNGIVKVTLSNDRTYTGKVYRDQRSDLAIVKIDAKRPLPYVSLADSDNIHVGQWAIAIGSPFGEQNTMTTGIVSALHRQTDIGSGDEARYYPNLIQTDASINPGNSGGPLLNINGELIGINVAIYSPSGANAGIGFAIPANTAKTVVDQLIANGRVVRGFLGLNPVDIPANLRDSLGIEKGARVMRVDNSSPARQAGIHAGDIITRFGDRDIAGQASLRDAIAATKPGTTVPVVLLRGGATQTVSVTLGKSPDEMAAIAPAAAPQPTAKLGVQVKPLTPEIARELRVDATVRGLVVSDINPGGAAAEAEVAQGDIITRINGNSATSVNSLERASAAAKPGDILTLTIVRSGGNPTTKDPNPASSELVIDITIP